MSFGNDSNKKSGVSKKQPKPKRGQQPTQLAECAIGTIAATEFGLVKVFRWIPWTGDVWVRLLLEDGYGEPMTLPGNTKLTAGAVAK